MEGKERLKKRFDRDGEKGCDAMCRMSALFFPRSMAVL